MNHNKKLAEWNRDKTWDSIEERLGDKKRKRPFFIWFFGSLVLVLVLLLRMAYDVSVNEDDLVAADVVSEKKGDTVENSKTAATLEALDTNPLAMEKGEPKKLMAGNRVEKIKKVDEVIIEDSVIRGPSNTNQNDDGISAAAQRLQKHGFSLGKTPNQKTIDQISDKPGGFTSQSDQPNSIKVIQLSRLQNNHINIDFSHYSSIKKHYPITVECVTAIIPSKTQGASSWLLFMETGHQSGRWNFQDADVGLARKATENFRFGSTTMIGAERNFGDDWFVRGGLELQVLFHKYDNSALSFSYEQKEIDSAYVYALNDGQFYYEAGERDVQLQADRRIIKNNLLYRVGMPVAIGKKLQLEKLELVAAVGLKPQVYSFFTGVIADADQQHVTDVSIIREHYLDHKMTVGVLTDVTMRWPISAHVKVGLGARYENGSTFGNANAFYGAYDLWSGYLGLYRTF